MEPSSVEICNNWKSDSTTIMNLIKDVRSFKKDYNDTDIQSEYKNEQMNKTVIKINKKYINTIITLHAVRVRDVTPEKVISDYGIKQRNLIINELKKNQSSKYLFALGEAGNNPLLDLLISLNLSICDNCFKATGRYEMLCEIPKVEISDEGIGCTYSKFNSGIDGGSSPGDSSETIEVEIRCIIKSKSDAVKINKGSINQLKSKIKCINYDSSFSSEKVILILEKM